MTTQDAVTYLQSEGVEIREVTALRMTRIGWRWYAPTVGQLLTDTDVVTFAQNQRELVS